MDFESYRSMIRSSSPVFRAFLVVLLTVALLGIVAACGGGEGGGEAEPTNSGGAGTTAASGILERAQEVAAEGTASISEWPGPTSSPLAQEGKKLVVISCAQVGEGCARQSRGAIEAGKALGWDTTLIDGQGSQDKWNQAINQAVTLNADGIYLASIDPRFVEDSVAKARAAGIAVVSGGADPKNLLGVQHDVSLKPEREGELLAYYIIAETDGDPKIALVNDSEFESVNRWFGVTKEIFGQCDTCEIAFETDISVTELSTSLGPRIKAALQSNPDIEVIWAPYDGAAVPIVQAVRETGLADSVWVASFGGNEQNLELIRNGEVQRVTIGQAVEWVGWAGVDNINRILAGEEPVSDDGVPVKILDASNVPPAGEPWEGDFDFRSEYRKLWGAE